jgi:hypothetical protein
MLVHDRIGRRVLAELLAQLCQPADWADDLERGSFARGKV